MPRRRLSAAFLIATALGALHAGPPKAPALDPKVLEGWLKAGALAPQHARLKAYVGTWATHQTDWLPSGTVWNEADGTAVIRPVLGGRFIQEDYTTNLNGHAFHGYGLMGFDTQHGAYLLLWMDDLNTSYMALSGSFDGTQRVLTLVGALPPGATGQATTAGWRVTDTWWDANHHAVVWWGHDAAGQPVKLSQILYTRNT